MSFIRKRNKNVFSSIATLGLFSQINDHGQFKLPFSNFRREKERCHLFQKLAGLMFDWIMNLKF